MSDGITVNFITSGSSPLMMSPANARHLALSEGKAFALSERQERGFAFDPMSTCPRPCPRARGRRSEPSSRLAWVGHPGAHPLGGK
jgi:hypothetical protein